jgi:hypothetical protein
MGQGQPRGLGRGSIRAMAASRTFIAVALAAGLVLSQATPAMIPAFTAGGQLRDIVALSATNIYTVGLDGEGFNARSLVLHWDGQSWTREVTPSPQVGPKMYGAAVVAPRTVWGVGYRYDQGVAANQTLTMRTVNG